MTDETETDNLFWQMFNQCAEPRPWCSESVAAYLQYAFEMLRNIPSSDAGPAAVKALWPAYLYTHEDRKGWFPSEREKANQRVRPRYSPQQVTLMERVLYWPVTILGHIELSKPTPAQAVGLYAAAQAYGFSFRKAYASAGWTRDTTYRRLSFGHDKITEHLNRAKIKL